MPDICPTTGDDLLAQTLHQVDELLNAHEDLEDLFEDS